MTDEASARPEHPADSSAERAALTDRAVAAARAVALRHGIETDRSEVLSERGNVVVHLSPHPLVARVCTLTAATRHDPGAWMRRELEVSRGAADRGGPVVAPTRLLDPGPHRHEGLWFSYWDHARSSGRIAGSAQVGRSLAGLHRATAGHQGRLPVLAPARDQVAETLDHLAASCDASTVRALHNEHDRVLDTLVPYADLPQLVLHGDAHAGNLLRVGARWVWADLEETCRGPALWDLAVASGGPARAETADAVLSAYAEDMGTTPVNEADLVPFRRARLLEAVVWLMAMAQRYPERYREYAARLLRVAGRFLRFHRLYRDGS